MGFGKSRPSVYGKLPTLTEFASTQSTPVRRSANTIGSIRDADTDAGRCAACQQCSDVATGLGFILKAAHQRASALANPAPAGFNQDVTEEIATRDDAPASSNIAGGVNRTQLDRLEG